MHYYQFNIKDYKAHTDHLSLMEDLAFRRMLDWIYLHEKPLPINPSDIAKRVLMPTHTESIEFVLSEFFELVEDGYINRTATDNIDSFKAKSEKASKSAKVRWDKKPDADEMRTHSEGNANHKPLTTNHKPQTTNQELSLKDKDLSPKVDLNGLFEKVWKQYPSKQNKKKALATFISYVNKNKLNAEVFADGLVIDICKRCNSQQFGFDKLHFTTYMNGERWNDEITQNLSDADAKHEAWKRSIQETDYTDLLGEQ
jgi:uncharacterized protein YdaU (DUF1376 family)